jgi:DNA sulfur modification protein DndD
VEIKLLGWESQGLRCPDLKVDIGSLDHVPKITLIQMPNGTGKTTTLNLIRAALTGEASNWTDDKILQLRHKDDTSTSTGRFLLRMMVDNQPLTFDLLFDFIAPSVTYRTSSPSTGGVQPGYSPQPSVKRFLKPKFTNLFVFDGEYSTHLLNENESRAEEAIDSLCQLDLLDQIKAVAESVWDRETKNKGAKTSQGLATYRNKEEVYVNQIKKITKFKNEAEDKLKTTKKEIEDIENNIGDKIKQSDKFRDGLEKLKLNKKDCENDLERQTNSAMALLRRPELISKQFLNGLANLKENLDKAKLPDVTSKQFFIELAEESLCVCGRPIGHNEKEHILLKTNQYLGNDVSGLINAIKQDIDLAINSREEHNLIDDSLAKLRVASNNYFTIDTELQALEQEALEDTGSDVTVLRSRLVELNTTKTKLEETLEHINAPPKTDDNETVISLSSLEKQLKNVRQTIAEITETVELRDKIDIINKMAGQIKSHARSEIKQALINTCNENLKKILIANPVEISKIDKSIHLSGQKEASVGQTLAVGYTFLTAALGRGQNKFPLIVDSPAGPLDDNVRKEIGSMVPLLCEQFIAFTISTEREHFLPALEKAADGNIKYLTIFRKNSGTKHLVNSLPDQGVNNTDGAVIVEGRDYFNSFTIVKELEE